MTTANIFSVGKNSNVYGALGSGSKNDARQVAEEAAEIFGAVMNQMSQELSSMQSESDFVSEASTVSTDMDSPRTQYEYSHKESRIEQSTESRSDVQNETMKKEVEELTEETIETICEKLNVSKEEVLDTMQKLGISETELLLPEMLGQLVMELTGETDVFNLLTNADFQAILQEIAGMEKEAAASFGMNLNQFQEVLQEMSGSRKNMQMDSDAMVVTERTGNGSYTEAVMDENLVSEDTSVVENSKVSEETSKTQIVTEQEGQELNQKLITGRDLEEKPEERKDLETKLHNDVESQNMAEDVVTRKMKNSSQEGYRENNQFEGRHQQLNDGTVVTNNMTGEIASNVALEESFSDISYSNIDVDDLMQQFVEKTQITVLENKTTMDMQLNPENLGKIYLHISTEEGNVQAQITTTNEIVKEALESQLATLRENLNQAGVKVDSVEISVATHEFEQNLEQNSKKEEEQAKMQEENLHARRNINMNSLDELAGVLSEEEVLVAQMMRDHGNSVDFTA